MLHIDPSTPLDTVGHLIAGAIPLSMAVGTTVRCLIHRTTTRKEQPK